MHHLTRLALNHPRATLAVLAVLTVALGAGLPRVRPEYGYRISLTAAGIFLRTGTHANVEEPAEVAPAD